MLANPAQDISTKQSTGLNVQSAQIALVSITCTAIDSSATCIHTLQYLPQLCYIVP